MLSTDQVLNKGRYRIVNAFSQDGTGGMYEAYDTVSNTNVVLRETVGSLGKVTTTSQLEAINLAFFGGAQALAETSHASLVTVQDYFADIDRQYLVLEPVAGSDLGRYLQAGQARPDLAEALSWADQLLDALQYLHSRPTSIVHGDIRPENVKLTDDLKVKLLVSCPHIDTNTNLITLAPIRASEDGGVNYRPLEQLWSGLDALSQRVILNHYDEESERWLLQPLSAATDLYSLAATVYAILSGTVPADALDRSIAALEGKADPLLSLAEVNPGVPGEVSNIIMKAMSLRREDRFYSAVILRQILHKAASHVKGPEAKTASDTAVTSPPPEMPQMLSNPEATRLEIESERKRLEEERVALEKRQAALDAEIAAQKLEEQRLERQAADERQRLEDERSAAEAAREQQRLAEEQEKEAAIAKLREETAQAVEVANVEVTNKETASTVRSVPADPDDDEDEDLLEVPGVPAPRVPTATPFISPAKAKVETSDLVLPDSDAEPSRTNWRLPAVAIGFVLVAATAFGIWKVSSAGSTTPSTSVPSQTAAMTQQPETVAADTQNQTEPEQVPVVETKRLNSVPATISPEKSPKTAAPAAIPEKPKKQPTPAPAKTPALKKAVTVDDLINDH